MSLQITYKPILDILKEFGSVIETQEGNVYAEIPFWMEIKNGEVILHTSMPEDLSQFLAKAGLGGDNPQPRKCKYE
jgi:hypothetical protein